MHVVYVCVARLNMNELKMVNLISFKILTFVSFITRFTSIFSPELHKQRIPYGFITVPSKFFIRYYSNYVIEINFLAIYLSVTVDMLHTYVFHWPARFSLLVNCPSRSKFIVRLVRYTPAIRLSGTTTAVKL